jgi:hypothetical protein
MRNRLLGAGLAAAALAVGAAPASAEVIVPSGSGITEPGGVVRTPDGKLWVADALRGVCQVEGTTLVPSPYCQEHVDTAEEPVGAATAPEASDLAFDPVSSTFWAAEGTSGSSGVWKLQWNPLTGEIASAEKIVDTTAGDQRVFGLDITRVPTGPATSVLEVDFVMKRSQLVQRISDAAGASPSVSAVGIGAAEDAADVARLDGKLYLAEPTGVTVVETPGGAVRDAIPVPELAGQIAGSLASDPATGRLYVGTDNGAGADQVIAFEPSTGRAEGYAGGMAGISALSLDTVAGAEGAVLAADDPAVASGAVDAENGGRILRFANVPLGRPRVVLDQAPPVVGTGTTASFAFSSTVPGADLECALDGGSWSACGSGSGTVSYGPLADGPHEVAFRATDAVVGTGAVLRHVFVIDTGAPSVTVDNPESDRTVTGDALDLRFTADEGGVTFDCAIDGGAPAPCSSPLRLRRLALGDHEVVVTATDMVGQTSSATDPAARWAFRTVPVPPKPAPAPPKGDDNSGPGNSDDRPRTPDVIRPFTSSDSSISCRSAITRRLNLARPPAKLRVAFPGGFKPGYVRMTVSKAGKRSKKQVKVISMHRLLESNRPCTSVTWGLWRSEARKLRKGTYRLTVLAGKDRRSARRVWAGSLRVIR